MAPQNIKLFAYLDIDNPIVAWEVAIGRIRSACDNTKDNFGISLWSYGLLRSYAKEGEDIRFTNELRLEEVRQKQFPRMVSRLKGVYFFESLDDAFAATERWGLKSKQKYITEVYFSSNDITRVDSEWVTSYLRSQESEWMSCYWRGDVLGEKPLVEVLASGIGVVHDQAIKVKAYKKIMDIWPYSTVLLAASCVGFSWLGLETIGQMTPALVARDERIVGEHYINVVELKKNEAEIVRLLDEAKKRCELPPIIRPPEQEAVFRVPDMRDLDFILRAKGAESIFKRLHSNDGIAHSIA